MPFVEYTKLSMVITFTMTPSHLPVGHYIEQGVIILLSMICILHLLLVQCIRVLNKSPMLACRHCCISNAFSRMKIIICRNKMDVHYYSTNWTLEHLRQMWSEVSATEPHWWQDRVILFIGWDMIFSLTDHFKIIYLLPQYCQREAWLISRWRNQIHNFMPWISVYHGEMDVIQWTWFFFHILSGRINTWKGVNQLKELFFLDLIIFFTMYIWNWRIIGILWLKTHYFSQLIKKMGFCCKI